MAGGAGAGHPEPEPHLCCWRAPVPVPAEGLSLLPGGLYQHGGGAKSPVWTALPLSASPMWLCPWVHELISASVYLPRQRLPSSAGMKRSKSFLACCQDMLLSEPYLSCFFVQLWLYFSDIVNGIYLWMRIDPFEMFVFAFDVLLLMLVTAR